MSLPGVHVVTGKLGSGKTLIAVAKIDEYLSRGCKVATNLDLYFEWWPSNYRHIECYRLPDHPQVEDLEQLGNGHDEKYHMPERNGLIVLDELGTWMNSRGWLSKGRDQFIDYVLHLRKRRWDVLFLIQHLSMMDKQVRDGIAEIIVHCRRFDRMRPPWVIDFLFHKPLCFLLGVDTLVPRIHAGVCKYGSNVNAPVTETWFYSGEKYFKSYNTEQIFSPTYNLPTYAYLPSRCLRKIDPLEILNEFKDKIVEFVRRTPSRFFFFVGLCFGIVSGAASVESSLDYFNKDKAKSKAVAVKVDKNPFLDWDYGGSVCFGSSGCDYYFTDRAGNPVNIAPYTITVDGIRITLSDDKFSRTFEP